MLAMDNYITILIIYVAALLFTTVLKPYIDNDN